MTESIEHTTQSNNAELVADNAVLRAKVAALEFRLDIAQRTLVDLHANVSAVASAIVCVVARVSVLSTWWQKPFPFARTSHHSHRTRCRIEGVAK
jgi:hypothetical protein